MQPQRNRTGTENFVNLIMTSSVGTCLLSSQQNLQMDNFAFSLSANFLRYSFWILRDPLGDEWDKGTVERSQT